MNTRNVRTVSWILLPSFMLFTGACTSLRPVGSSSIVEEQGIKSGDTTIRVTTQEGTAFVFPGGQYRIADEAGVSTLAGWGDKVGDYGIIERGYFELSMSAITAIEAEKIDAKGSLLMAGLFVAGGILAYLAISQIQSADDKPAVGEGEPGNE